ncbi:MAG: HalOD1 output domain-containing protein [Halosimplex sp.]
MRDRNQGDDDGDAEGHSAGSTEAVAFDHYDWESSDSPSVSVAEAVAAVTNRSVTALPPLQGIVDADALDTLLRSNGDAVEISFDYADTVVTLSSDGRIVVEVETE